MQLGLFQPHDRFSIYMVKHLPSVWSPDDSSIAILPESVPLNMKCILDYFDMVTCTWWVVALSIPSLRDWI